MADRDQVADLFDPAGETGVDVIEIPIEDEIRLEVLDLRELDLFRPASPWPLQVRYLAYTSKEGISDCLPNRWIERL